eukprot:3131472-Rhodomonas_salina.1
MEASWTDRPRGGTRSSPATILTKLSWSVASCVCLSCASAALAAGARGVPRPALLAHYNIIEDDAQVTEQCIE